MKPSIPKGTRDFGPVEMAKRNYIFNTIRSVYEELPGWKTDMTHFTSESQFPKAFSDYIKFLEKELETPIKIISIGPDRDQTIVRH